MSRPNFLLFMPDQLRADALGCFGSPVGMTPAFDALAERGVRCVNAWSQHSVCGPSRVSIMTGWYPHVAGHRSLDNLIKPWEPNLLSILRQSGYYVAMAGNRGDVFAPGVTEASTDFCGTLVDVDPDAIGKRYGSPFAEDHRLHRAMYFGSSGEAPLLDFDEATVRTAEIWLAEGMPTDRPWVLWVPLLFPHSPFKVEEPWFSLHDRSAMPDPIAPVPSGKPQFMAALRQAYGWEDLTPDDVREIMATYHGMVSRVDSQLARLITALERADAIDDTVVITLSDHGEYLGDFGLFEKWPSGLDPCLLRNPLIFAGPGLRPGSTIEQPVELVDLLPTLCDLGEAEVGHTHFGKSLLPIFEGGESAVHRDFACAEGGFRASDGRPTDGGFWIYQHKADLQHHRPELVGTAMALRTTTFTYVHRRYELDELYDRTLDPSEANNLIMEPGLKAVATALREKLFGWLADTSDVVPWESDPRFPEIPNGWREAP
jgi:arylsulfatase A-like enzyme